MGKKICLHRGVIRDDRQRKKKKGDRHSLKRFFKKFISLNGAKRRYRAPRTKKIERRLRTRKNPRFQGKVTLSNRLGYNVGDAYGKVWEETKN